VNAPNPFKRTSRSCEETLLCHGREEEASVLALFSAALGDAGDGDIAIHTLRQLSDELTVLKEYFRGEADLNPTIITNVLGGMAERARAAAEVQRRVEAARSES
jgi:hypothetical protein